jgi:hypothetical protein
VVLAAFLAACAAPAFAQAPGGDAQICTDRPGKGNNACTVPAGKVQLETDLLNWTRMTEGGTRTDTILYTDPMLKLGLTGSSDLQIAIAPYEEVRTRTAGATDRIGGVGDLFVRYKKRLTAEDAGTQIALIPFVKAPTARRGIGNRKWEGGLAVPFGFDLRHDVALGLSPEIDLLADDDGSGRHLSLSNAVDLGKTIGKMTVAAELWGQWNFDPAGTGRQYSADATVTWLARPALQFDAGANFGLNRQTPEVQLYVGVSKRF